MNKTQLIDFVAEMNDVPTKAAAKRIVDNIFDTISDAIALGEDVAISGFGTFHVVERAEREGRNPQDGSVLHIPAKSVAKFRASRKLKEAVNA